MEHETGMIFDIKRFALFDGPGIRTTVFMKGCPLHCPWCHNPEGISPTSELIIYDNKCIACTQCLNSCPYQAISLQHNAIKTDYFKCNNCGSCATICPSTSRQIIGHHITTTELLKDLKKDQIFYEHSSGGVTFSGGEPLHQPNFLKTMLTQLKNQDIHTTIDTSGYAPTQIFNSILTSTDLLLYDLKILNDTLHQKYTGVSNKIIKKNLAIAQEKNIPISIRFTVIPEITDTNENITEFISYLQNLNHIKNINLLPYHNVQEKFKRLGKHYTLPHGPAPTNDDLKEIKEKFEEIGIPTTIGG